MRKIFFLYFTIMLLSSSVLAQGLFKETTPLTAGRQMHGAVVLGDYLYVLGGHKIKENYTNSVEFAKINPDGSIGKFAKTSPLPKKISYIDNCTFSLNDIVYIATGWSDPEKKSLNTILWAKPRADGQLEKWNESVPYPGAGVNCASAVAASGYIHVIGGLSAADKPSTLVWSAKIAPDGSIAGWEPGPQIPETMWYQCSGVSQGKVWIWGGLKLNDNKVVSQNSYFAPILSNGKLGPWQLTNAQLPQKFYGASCSVSGNYLISFSPRYAGKVISNDIWYTTASSNGIAEWTKMPNANIKCNIYMALATDYRRGNIYICGGRESGDSKANQTDKVYYIKLVQSEQASTQYDVASTYDAGNSSAASGNYSYVAQSQERSGKFPGFIPFTQAQQILATQRKPLLIYFYSDRAKKCIEQSQILLNFNPSQYGGNIIFAEVETVLFPQAAQQNGIFKVPTWVMFDANGNEKFRHSGVLDTNSINTGVNQVMGK